MSTKEKIKNDEGRNGRPDETGATDAGKYEKGTRRTCHHGS
jgi:hypothetical protein